MRLQKFLAECGVASRRESEGYIADGRVTINGRAAKIGDTVDPRADTVLLDGSPVRRDDKVYIVLHKPKGVITSAKDTHDRKTVLDCVQGAGGRVFPVGRLDLDVSGALILTNDGELAYRLTHPKYQVNKVYLAWVQGKMPQEAAQRLTEGVALEDGITAPGQCRIVKQNETSTLIRLIIHEGRKRLVKRMCAAVGHPVRDLRRLSVGTVCAAGLIPGEWRYLTDDEVRSLRQMTGLRNGMPDPAGPPRVAPKPLVSAPRVTKERHRAV